MGEPNKRYKCQSAVKDLSRQCKNWGTWRGLEMGYRCLQHQFNKENFIKVAESPSTLPSHSNQGQTSNQGKTTDLVNEVARLRDQIQYMIDKCNNENNVSKHETEALTSLIDSLNSKTLPDQHFYPPSWVKKGKNNLY